MLSSIGNAEGSARFLEKLPSLALSPATTSTLLVRRTGDELRELISGKLGDIRTRSQQHTITLIVTSSSSSSSKISQQLLPVYTCVRIIRSMMQLPSVIYTTHHVRYSTQQLRCTNSIATALYSTTIMRSALRNRALKENRFDFSTKRTK